MKIFSLTNRCLVFTLLVINLFCISAFGREYSLEVVAAKDGFKIITNIPKVGDKQAAVAKDTDAIPTTTFNAPAQDFLLAEDGRSIEIALDKLGHITVKKLNVPDVLRITNRIAKGDIIFAGSPQQQADNLKLYSCGFRNDTDLSVNAFDAVFSGWFNNTKSLTINNSKGNGVSVQESKLICSNFHNAGQLVLQHLLTCTGRNFFYNKSKASISGQGSLHVATDKFLNEAEAAIALDGKLEVQPLPKKTSNEPIKQCSWQCDLDKFSVFDKTHNEWVDGFLGEDDQKKCLQLRNASPTHFHHEPDCNEILLLGIVSVGDCNLSAETITLQASMHVNNDCIIKPLYIVRNSGTLYVKNMLDIQGGDFFYNDVNAIMSAGKNINLNCKKIVANISGVISAYDVTITADKLINARGELSASKAGDIKRDNFVYKQFETYPLGYILAREANLNINVNELYQETSCLRASNDIDLNVKQKFVNDAREIQEFSTHVDHIENVGKKQAKAEQKIREAQAEEARKIREEQADENKHIKKEEQEINEEKAHLEKKIRKLQADATHDINKAQKKMNEEQAKLERKIREEQTDADKEIHKRQREISSIQADADKDKRKHPKKASKIQAHANHDINKQQQKINEEKAHLEKKIRKLQASASHDINKAQKELHEEQAKLERKIKEEQADADKSINKSQRKINEIKSETAKKINEIKAKTAKKIREAQDDIKQEVAKGTPKKIKFKRVIYGDKQNMQYEASTISAGGKVVITLKDTKVEFNAPQMHYTIKDFYNTGTIQGQQILELTSDEKAKLVNGFTHKKQPAVFGALPTVIDLEDGMLAKEYEIQKNNDCYYKIHPLFNENKSLNLLQEVVINAPAVKKETLFLMSPLLEAMGLEFALHKHIGKIKLAAFKDHYEQLDVLQKQGWVYALIQGTFTPVAGVNQGGAQSKLALTDQQKNDYQTIIKSFGGTITAEEYARRVSLLEAKTHVVTLSDAQINAAPVAFIFYKIENRDGKDYLHPYLHPDKDAFEKMRRADGSLQGGEVKITGGNLQNFGFIKADKELLIKVTSFLNERPLQERLDGIYKIIKTKPGGEYEAANATITTQNDLTFKGGTGTAAKGANTLKSEQGNVNLVNQEITNPQALDHAKKAAPSTLTAATDNNVDAKQDFNLVNSQMVAGQNTNITAGGTASATTTATPYLAKDDTVCTGKKHSCKTKEHRKEEDVSVTPATVISGNSTTMQAGEKNELTGATMQAGKKIELNAPQNSIKPVVVETTSTTDTKTKKIFFYDHTKSTRKRQTIIPSMLQADEIVIKSSELDTTLEAVVMYGGRLVHIVSGRNTVFAGTQLHSSMRQKGWSFGISFLGSAAIQALADGDYKGAVIALAESDPLVAAIMALSKAKDGADAFAASEYVGIEALRGLVQLSKAAKIPAMTGIGQRLRVLNNEGKFRPQITFSLGFHKASADQWETVPSEINAMKLVVESGKETAFKDGTTVTAEESKITSNVVTFTPAATTQHSTKKNVGFDLTFGPCGFGAGVNVGKGKQHSVHYQNAAFNVAAQTWQAEDMHGQGVTLKGRVGHFDVKKLHLESVQNIEKGKETNVGVSGSQGGAFSGFFNYHKVDNAWINERSCLEFEQLHGHAAMLKLIAADMIARQKNSTFKADKTEGKTLRDHLDTFGIGLGFGYLPDDVIPVSADFNYIKQHSGGTQKAYASEHVQTGQTDNVVRDEKDKFVADKKKNTHVHFVAAWIDTQQVKDAYNDLQSLFKKDKVTCQDFNEKMDALKKLGKVRELTDADRVLPAQQSEQTQQQAPDSVKSQTEQTQAQQGNEPQEQARTTHAGSAEHEVQKEALQPCHYPFKTKSGQTIDVHFSENNTGVEYTSEYSAQGVFVVEDQIYDPATKQMQIMLRNNQFRVSIKGDMMSLAEVYMDRKMQINAMIAKSHVPYGNAHDDSTWLGVASSVVLDFVPIIGNLKMGAEAIYGYDLVTGEKLAWWQRLISAGAAVAGPAAQFLKVAAKGAKTAEVIVDASKIAKATKVAEAVNEVGKTAKVVEGAAEGTKIAEVVGEGAKVESIIIDDFVNAASKSFKEGQFSVAGRALTKHPNIVGAKSSSELYLLFKNQSGINNAAIESIKNIVQNGERVTKNHKVFGSIIDFKLPNGLGARFSAETKEFIHFLGRGLE